MNSGERDRLVKLYQRGHSVDLPKALSDNWSWQMRARCRGLALEQFFPAHELPAKSRKRIEDQAKRVCTECPVVLECRSHAIRCHEPSGVWGGLTLAERIESTRT